MQDTSTIGDRLRRARRERGLSQSGLAERSGISQRFIAKIEQGNGQPSLPNVYALANALGMEPSRLLDKQEQFTGSAQHHGILALRDAVLTTGDLPGLGDDNAAQGQSVPLAALERGVSKGWDLYWAGRFGELAGHLPPLIFAARAAEKEQGGAVSRPLAQAYQLAADLFVHVGSDDLAFAVTRRALRAAHRGSDPLQYATLAGTLSWVSLHQGRLEDAERVARVAAANITPAGKALMKNLTVYGALLLSAAAPAAAAGKTEAARAYLAEAQLTALRYTQGDRHDYEVSFGPTQVAMQACHVNSVLREPAVALRAARRVHRDDLRPISWGALNLDIGRANLDKGHRYVPEAVDALLEALDVSEEWARHQGLWRDSVAAAVHADRRRSAQTHKLAVAAGLRLNVSD